MFENIMKIFRRGTKKPENALASKDAAKERLHLVLLQDRANVSADFLDLMRQEIIDVIKKYIEVDENAIDVKLTNKENDDGTNGAPALYANIPIINIKEIVKKENTNKTKIKEEPVKVSVKELEKEEIKEEPAPKEKKEEVKVEPVKEVKKEEPTKTKKTEATQSKTNKESGAKKEEGSKTVKKEKKQTNKEELKKTS